MPPMTNPYEMPNLPTAPTYDNIMATIRSIGLLPTLSQSVVPEVRGIYGEGGPVLGPQIGALRESAAQGVAAAQSDAMARGLTGSSIEAASMGQARVGGLQAEAGLRGQVGQSLIELLFRAEQGDIQAATQLRTMIAQAMGQEYGALRDIQLMREQMSFGAEQAAKDRKAQLWAAAMSGTGTALAGWGQGRSSDRRLKTNVRRVGSSSGVDIVRFRWGKRAAALGLKPGKESVGVVAQQVREVYPGAVGKRDGYLTVNYEALPIDVVAAVAAVRRE